MLTVDASNKDAKDGLAAALLKQKQSIDKDKKTYAGMFQKFAKIDAKVLSWRILSCFCCIVLHTEHSYIVMCLQNVWLVANLILLYYY